MEFFDALNQRRSIRAYLDQEVPDETLKKIAEAAHLAPTINDAPLLKIIGIKKKALIKEMADIVREAVKDLDIKEEDVRASVEVFSTFFADAPALLIFARRPYEAVIEKGLGEDLTPAEVNAMRGHPDVLSIGAAVQNALLAATALDYQSCWLSAPLIAREKLEKLLGIEGPWQISAMATIGKGDKPAKPRAASTAELELIS